MNVYDIKHAVMRGRMSAKEAYDLVKANASKPFFVTSGQLEEFRKEAAKEAKDIYNLLSSIFTTIWSSSHLR